jgi:DNA polymerase-1
MQQLAAYQEIWAVDFEFLAPPGERPSPVCLVARELRSGRTIKQWRGGFSAAPPFRIDERALFVAYYASAELGCFLQLGWPKPTNVLDLFTEFRNLRNGLSVPAGFGLLGALTYFGLPHMSSAHKDASRDLVMRGGPWTADEQTQILDYCEDDVRSLERLLAKMEPHLDMPRALLRGRYMAAAACIEWTGVPIDTDALELLRARWDDIKAALIAEIDADYGVFEGTTFKLERFANYLVREGMAWPRLESGQLDLSDDTFREMARTNPKVAPLRELRDALSKMRLSSLTVGSDGRNRTLLSAFRARTGRNQPSNAKFIFGPSAWLRSLIKPTQGNAIAYIDWQSQEFGIAAALSGDPRMKEAYLTADPYLAFAKQSGAVPADATKDSHKQVRDVFKMVVLGVGYGMEAETLAARIGIPAVEARALLRLHRETYPRFWQWSQNAVDTAMLSGRAQTVFGWHIHIGPDVNPRSLGNFAMQANGAEMLRIACCLATERGIRVCAPIHDAVMIEAPADAIEAEAAKMQELMRAASRIVLGGFELGTDADFVRWPDRYSDPRGEKMWERTMRLARGKKTYNEEERAA